MTPHKTLAIVSGLAIAAAHPEPSIWPLGWIGLAPLLAANPDLEIGLCFPGPLNGNPHQPANTLDIQDIERIVLQYFPFFIQRKEFIFSVLS